jgi:hypothetical protein
MANIPTINRTSPAYSPAKPATGAKLNQAKASKERTESVRGHIERRRSGDRRRRNIQVLFNRRTLKDRRQSTHRDKASSGPEVRRGNRINTTA